MFLSVLTMQVIRIHTGEKSLPIVMNLRSRVTKVFSDLEVGMTPALPSGYELAITVKLFVAICNSRHIRVYYYLPLRGRPIVFEYQ